MFRIAPLALVFAIALLGLAPTAQADDTLERELPNVRVDLAAGQPGIQQAAGKIVWTRFANLKRGQAIDFFATAQGGDFVLRVLDPRGNPLFDAVPIPEDTNVAKRTYTYGFHYEARDKGRHQIQCIADAKSKLRVTSNGFLRKVPRVTLPGTWSLDYETLAWELLNLKGAPAADLERMKASLVKKVEIQLVLRADGSFEVATRTGRRRIKNTGRWSVSGDRVTFTTLTEDGTTFAAKDQKKEVVEFTDGQIVMPKEAGRNPFSMHLDKVK